METNYIEDFRNVVRIFDRELLIQNNYSCCNGVSVTQCHTLLEIENKETITISELAENLSLDKSTVSRTVDGLVNIGLVNRTIPAENRRKAEISLTNNGKNTCSTINCTNNTFFEEVFNGFSDEEKQAFIRLFSKLTNNMKKLRGQVSCCDS